MKKFIIGLGLSLLALNNAAADVDKDKLVKNLRSSILSGNIFGASGFGTANVLQVREKLEFTGETHFEYTEAKKERHSAYPIYLKGEFCELYGSGEISNLKSIGDNSRYGVFKVETKKESWQDDLSLDLTSVIDGVLSAAMIHIACNFPEGSDVDENNLTVRDLEADLLHKIEIR